MLNRLLCLICVGLACSLPAVLSAQTSRDARLSVTVVDPSGAIVSDATVTVVGLDATTKTAAPLAATTSDKGLAIVEGLVPGRYSITAAFPGFDLGLLRDIRLRSGTNRHVVVLPIRTVEESITVRRDAQTAASTRANAAFGTSLSVDQIGALSDDPAEVLRQLTDLAGPDAIVRIDSFEGQPLPPKAQIKSIHVTRDQFAAEAEQPGSTFVDVVTQPGSGPLRGTATLSFRHGSMSARSPFAQAKGPEQIRNYAATIGGTLVKEKSNFSLSINGRNEYSTPILNVALPGGLRAATLNLRQPHALAIISGLLDFALTRDQTLRVGYSQNVQSYDNSGVGGFDLPERAFSLAQHTYTIRALETGPIGRRSFINTRLTMTWANSVAQAALEAPTIIVQDAFTIGGAQQAGGTHNRVFSLASDLDHVRGIHSWRAGFLVSGSWFRSDQNDNYLGTYTFSSLSAYQNGQPAIFVRQVGDPTVTGFNGQGAVYIQDDIRVRKTLTLSPGVRYSIQTHVPDLSSLDPRFGLTWAPFKSGRTTLRASAGLFNGWLPRPVYEQTLRFDGTHQQEVLILNPSFPDTGTTGTMPPSNKYLLGDFKLQGNVRYSGGVDHVFSPRGRANVLYAYWRQFQHMCGRNLNAPVDGVRPDPAFANIIESVTDAEFHRHDVSVNITLNMMPTSPTPNGARFNWRRINLTAGLMSIHSRNNSAGGFVNEGSFAVPPSGSLDAEWGPGPTDMPYRVNVSLSSTQVKNLAVNVAWNASDGSPYTWTTGVDDNQDGLLNDRPAGVGLRTLRTAQQSTINARITYTFAPGSAGGASGQTPNGQPRYRLGLHVSVNNLTNHANCRDYSGNQTSPFFRQPTSVSNPRKIDMGLNISF